MTYLDKWDTEKFGPAEDYNAVEREELEGWHVDDTVRLAEDNEEGGFEGDEGVIVGFSHTEAGMFGPARDELLVLFHGYGEPVGVSPYIVVEAD